MVVQSILRYKQIKHLLSRPRNEAERLRLSPKSRLRPASLDVVIFVFVFFIRDFFQPEQKKRIAVPLSIDLFVKTWRLRSPRHVDPMVGQTFGDRAWDVCLMTATVQEGRFRHGIADARLNEWKAHSVLGDPDNAGILDADSCD